MPVASIHGSQSQANSLAAHSAAFLLSIVIVSWNTRDLLAQCLQSVRGEIEVNFDQESVETFVVDNASTDDTVAHLRTHFPWVRVIENQTNLGFAAANNQALARCQGRYVLLLNPDTQVLPGALHELVNFLEQTPTAGAAGARLLNPDGTLQLSCYPEPTLRRELWRLFHLDRLRPYALYPVAQWSINQPRPVDTVQGAVLLVRRALLDQVGLLDTAYFIYTEEVDLCTRIRRAGWQINWVPTAVVIHYGGQSTRQVASAMFLKLYQSKLIFFRKHGRAGAAVLYKLILLAASVMRLVASPLAWLLRPGQRPAIQTIASYYWQLLRALPAL
jgi:N-acetylglucosaminyl-diphospho-decaprenol L-rhamnosyltransferase